MASVEEKDATAAAAAGGTTMSYKDALVDGGVPDPDPAVTTSDQPDKGDAKAPAKEEKKKDGAECLKSNLLISGAVIAIIGAIFAIVKKMKEA